MASNYLGTISKPLQFVTKMSDKKAKLIEVIQLEARNEGGDTIGVVQINKKHANKSLVVCQAWNSLIMDISDNDPDIRVGDITILVKDEVVEQ